MATKKTKKTTRKLSATYIATLTKKRDAAALKLAKYVAKLTGTAVVFYRLEDGPLIAFEATQRALNEAKTRK